MFPYRVAHSLHEVANVFGFNLELFLHVAQGVRLQISLLQGFHLSAPNLIGNSSMNVELWCSNSIDCFLSAEGVGYHVSLARMVFDGTVIIVEELNPATLSHVQLLMIVVVLKTLMVGIDGSFGTLQIMSSNL